MTDLKRIYRGEIRGLGSSQGVASPVERREKLTVTWICFLPDNVGRWNPGKHTEPFYDGNLDDYTVSRKENKQKRT